MARIRTVKPDIWTDPEFVECSSNARLLLLASLNFASDYGVLIDKPTQLKMQCFPGDNVDVVPLIEELITARFYERRTAPDGSRVLVIRTFTRHQKVDKPQPGRWGNPADWPPFVEDSKNVPGAVVERSTGEGNGMEGKGRGEDTLNDPPSGSSGTKPIPFASEFEEWWKLYPRKDTGKAKALKAFQARRREGIQLDDLMRAVANYAVERQGEPNGYSQHGATFLAKGGPWSDRLEGPLIADTGKRDTRYDRNARALDEFAGLDAYIDATVIEREIA